MFLFFLSRIFLEYCQAKLEMSYSYQSRNVLFLGFRFYGFTSFISVNTKLETLPPRMVGWRSIGSSPSDNNQLFALSDRPCGYLFESQSPTLIGHDH